MFLIVELHYNGRINSGCFSSRSQNSREKTSKLKQFFRKTRAYFSKNSRNRKFSKKVIAKLSKLTNILSKNVTCSYLLLLYSRFFVKNSLNAMFSKANFL